MPDYRVMFDRNYLGHLDLGGRDVTLTIAKAVGGELTAEGGRKSRKPIIHFGGNVKPMICNKTNAKTIAALYGNETGAWAGKKITLYTSTTRNPDGGGMTECVRIRPKVPSAKTDTAITEQPAPEEHIVPSTDQPAPARSNPPSIPSSAASGADAGADLISADEALAIEARCTENNILPGKVKKFFKVELFSQMTPKQLTEAHAMIDSTLADRKAKETV